MKVKRCYFFMFNARHDLMDNLTVLKTSKGSNVKVQFLFFACNEKTGVAECVRCPAVRS